MSNGGHRTTYSVRRALAEYGWLHPIRTASTLFVTIDELSCPECDSEEIIQSHNPFEIILYCPECEHSDEIAHEELYRDGDGDE